MSLLSNVKLDVGAMLGNLRDCVEKRNREDSTLVIRARHDAIIMENETPGNARQHWRTTERMSKDENCRRY